ncbi:FkbM family methyltransferase [Aphanizomenon sp. UHCC 0183]|uniref:FkbM family methyltransferase n=1 Tax=Aphanizomenon sp. UHCC 0183 TaxID=2590028 RepID=UPI0014465552|nr:FkbM family methyltransferase [Aphanizomenon sp. UHCC 0183]MTJ32276.1 FkbM family methyltransferase [Aphanizomenon sp. UHCC 0183]
MSKLTSTFQKIVNNVNLLIEDPVTFTRKIKYLYGTAQSENIKIGKDINFYIDLNLEHPAIRGMYFGIYEVNLIDALKKFLKHGDTFIDVGANIGYISGHALSFVGKSGSIHAFEPVPKYFNYLTKFRDINANYSITLNNLALGSATTFAKIAINETNFGWNTMVPDFMSNGVKEEIEVQTILLDDYVLSLDKIERENISVIKIDVEGYEFEVLKGGYKFLKDATKPPIIIVEINTSAYPKLGYTAKDISDFMSSLNYSCKSLNLQRNIDLSKLTKTTDVCFVPQNTKY